MVNEAGLASTTAAGWQAKHVYAMAAVCLVVGLALGYLFRGSQSLAAPKDTAHAQGIAPAGMGTQTPTLDQMKHMADKKAEPLLEKLKSNPNNADLLVQLGNIYRSTHQFKEAADYYAKSLTVNPQNVTIRTELASCLYYLGDVDGALKQLQQATTDDPKDANSLFNLGVIRWREKRDAKGALAAWQQLLKSNPKLDPDKKSQVEKLMTEVREQDRGN